VVVLWPKDGKFLVYPASFMAFVHAHNGVYLLSIIQTKGYRME
jgi:hypothetical protein